MIPAGYMAKRIVARPDWLKADAVADIYSVSACSSKNFADYVSDWRHNGFWLFNRPGDITQLACDRAIDLSGTVLFYYEVFEQQFDETAKKWSAVEPELSLDTNVERPKDAHLEGFDVVSFCAGTSAECSPLSCNSLAEECPVNRHCLMARFEEAVAALERGEFDECEPGPFRVFAVYSVPSTDA
ncbi:MAG TPA: hypothetical protein VL492_01055 [Methylovirgula sp.]|jgi:hypothetical protein|nr:hypothetical protein [Methylovirgula sp.]